MPDSFKMKWDINWLYFLLVVIMVTQGIRNYALQSDINTLMKNQIVLVDSITYLEKQADFQMGVATSQNYVNIVLVNKVFDRNITVPDINVSTVFKNVKVK